MNAIRSYRDLTVWQRSSQLAVAVYHLTEHFPSKEQFELTSQMRSAAVSIASNIAEGSYRSTRKDFRNFLRISYASGAELETQIFIAKQLPHTCHCDYVKVDALPEEVMKMLNKFIYSLQLK